MDNVQNCDSYINVSSSWTYRFHTFLVIVNELTYLRVEYLYYEMGMRRQYDYEWWICNKLKEEYHDFLQWII
jgi:hypothetical protein